MNIKIVAMLAGGLSLMGCGEVPVEDQMKDCRTVAAPHIQNILDGVQNTADLGKFRLDNVYAVRSNDREKIYFVSGKLTYKPTNTSHGIGTWILNNIGSGNSIYWAMPGTATEQTVYPDATRNKAKFSEWDHGYVQSRSCTRLGTEL